MNRNVTITMDDELFSILQELADIYFNGNKSETVRQLVGRFHAYSKYG